jgi:hypothetical protein
VFLDEFRRWDGGQDDNADRLDPRSIDRWAAVSLMGMGYEKSPEGVSLALLITEHRSFSPAGFSDRSESALNLPQGKPIRAAGMLL